MKVFYFSYCFFKIKSNNLIIKYDQSCTFIYASHLFLKDLRKHNQELFSQTKMQLQWFFSHILLNWLSVLGKNWKQLILQFVFYESVETRNSLEIIKCTTPFKMYLCTWQGTLGVPRLLINSAIFLPHLVPQHRRWVHTNCPPSYVSPPPVNAKLKKDYRILVGKL